MLHNGFSYEQIATALMLDEVTVRRYRKKYEKKGVAGLMEFRYTGGRPILNPSQEEELKAHLKEHTYLKAKEIVVYVKKRYGISYTVSGMTTLLHRLGFVYKKPKVVPGKAAKDKQEEFVVQYEAMKGKLRSEDQVYFIDSTHPQHNTRPTCGWIPKGEDKLIPTNSGRKRINLNGALNLRDYTVIVNDEHRVNTGATLRLLKQLQEKHRRGKIYLILDNASYHHAKEVKIWLKRYQRFKVMFIPAYSPNLNLIERLWKFFYEKVLANRYYATFAQFKKAIFEFFENLSRYQQELSTLITDSFQIVPSVKLQT